MIDDEDFENAEYQIESLKERCGRLEHSVRGLEKSVGWMCGLGMTVFLIIFFGLWT